METKWLCDEFHCLPSQLENEDFAQLKRMRYADYLYDMVQVAKSPKRVNEMAAHGELSDRDLETIKYILEQDARPES